MRWIIALLIVVSVAGLVWGGEAVRAGRIVRQGTAPIGTGADETLATQRAGHGPRRHGDCWTTCASPASAPCARSAPRSTTPAFWS